MNNAYALIMAGGSGTRLWPLSREKYPKPLLPLVEARRSMFQISVERLYPLFPPEHILVVAGPELTPLLRQQTPNLPAENFIVEPFGQDTAPAIGLSALHVRRRDPSAVMAVLTADHHIADVSGFLRILDAACRAAQNGLIVTLGIKPDFPSTGFGYIRGGDLVETQNGVALYRLEEFKEKPDEETARQYVSEGVYSWNSGMFIWQIARVLDEFQTHSPAHHALLERIDGLIGRPDYDAQLAQVWRQMPKKSVDYALMEHIKRDICVIPAEIGWSDIGNFEALYDILSGGADENVISGHQPLLHDSRRLLVFSDRLVAAIGLEDMVIIDTEDVLLVCPRDRAQDVKKLVEELKSNKQSEYL